MSISVLTPAEMRTLEERAFSAGIPSLLLMEHAAEKVTDALERELGGCKNKKVLFLCGKGNNGGDGLAAARLFKDRGGLPCVYLNGVPGTPDARTNLRMAALKGIPVFDLSARDNDADEEDRPLPEWKEWDAFVDALYGIGFHGVMDDLSSRMALLTESLSRHVPVIAVDVPSGLDALSGEAEGTHVNADVTVTFHAPKTGLLLTRERAGVGRIEVADIGLGGMDEDVIPPSGELKLLERSDLFLPERDPVCHKGDMGRVLILAGSMGMAGAAAMCARACLTAGAGLVTVACDAELIPVLQTLVPSAMCVDVREARETVPNYDVFCCGCGIRENEESWQALTDLWDPEKPSVWDAGALNLLARHPMKLGSMAVITPHVGEAARLLRTESEQVLKDRVSAARALESKYGCAAVLKSDVTVIANGGELSLVACGSPALAKGGSGDVLCGMIAALCASEAPCPEKTGPLWHALASQHGSAKYGTREMTAQDLILCLHDAEKDAAER